MSRKSIGGIVIAILLACSFLGVTRWLAHYRAALCINQMRQWEAAAESYCLANAVGTDASDRVSPERVLSLESLSAYVKGGMSVSTCPSGDRPYAPFTVANGPVCPNGHDMAPGELRPFQAYPGSKLAVVYSWAGWTNMTRTAAEQPPAGDVLVRAALRTDVR